MKCLLLSVNFVLSNYAPEEEEEGRSKSRNSKNYSERCFIIKLGVIRPCVLGLIRPSLACYKGSGFAVWAARSAELKSNAPFFLGAKVFPVKPYHLLRETTTVSLSERFHLLLYI